MQLDRDLLDGRSCGGAGAHIEINSARGHRLPTLVFLDMCRRGRFEPFVLLGLPLLRCDATANHFTVHAAAIAAGDDHGSRIDRSSKTFQLRITSAVQCIAGRAPSSRAYVGVGPVGREPFPLRRPPLWNTRPGRVGCLFVLPPGACRCPTLPRPSMIVWGRRFGKK